MVQMFFTKHFKIYDSNIYYKEIGCSFQKTVKKEETKRVDQWNSCNDVLHGFAITATAVLFGHQLCYHNFLCSDYFYFAKD